MADLFNTMYNPDVLSCIANLSNDEVFTPPDVANAMLDMLPQELFQSPDTKFLDPACKTGVFLREIAKRLLVGLEPVIPNLQDRIDHIFRNQLFGIAITELTAHLSRRSLYCSKTANGNYSVSKFETVDGNVRYKIIQHRWQKGKCTFCGASQKEYDRAADLETHAYELIHATKPEEIFKVKFDVIISNPPYQLGVGNEGGNSAKAKAIYHQFVSQAVKLNPRYLTMIIPSRWMTRSVEGIPDTWIDDMLNCNKISVLHDYLNAGDCFSGVSIEGGVCYFLREKDYTGKCHYYLHKNNKKEDVAERFDYLNPRKLDIIIRDTNALVIIDKINKVTPNYILEEKANFSSLVSPKDFFTNKVQLTSSWKGFSQVKDDKRCIKYYLNKNIHRTSFGWVSKEEIPKNTGSIKLHKVYIPAARGGAGKDDNQVLGTPFYGEPGSVCSQTYLVIGYDPIRHNLSKQQCLNIIGYVRTKFFRYLVNIKKKTQNGPRAVYQFVPLQDFNKEWTDEKLYKKYGLSKSEINLIEKTIKPMDLEGDD